MSAGAQVKVVSADLWHLDQLDTDGLVLALFADQRPLQGVADLVDWRLCGELSRWIRAGQWTGQAGEQVLMPGRQRLGARRLFLFGLGMHRDYASTAGALGQRVVRVLQQAGCQRAAFALPAPSSLAAQALQVVIEQGSFTKTIAFDEDSRLDAVMEHSSAAGKKNRT